MNPGIKHIYYAKYQLHPKAILNAKSQQAPRCGALLRFDFADNGTGYADCYPWVELGDLPLDEQLRLLSSNKMTPLTEKSLYFANIDAQHRAQNRSVFLDKKSPKSHFIMPYENLSLQILLKYKSMGFHAVKLKFGKDLNAEISCIQKYYSAFKELGIQVRLDFNSSVNKDSFKKFLLGIENELDVIDFIEDPCEFVFEDWVEIQKNHGINLALDRKNEAAIEVLNKKLIDSFKAFKVIIIKPALEDIQNYFLHTPPQRIIFTSYMDHPLGQLCAVYEAAVFYTQLPYKEETCGFLTHPLFEANPYSEQLNIQDTVLLAQQGPGFGFEELLQQETWIPV